MHLLPEHTFAFAKDGSLASVCDVPIAQVSVIFDGTVQPINAALLDVPVRDFNTIEFKNAGAATVGRRTGSSGIPTFAMPFTASASPVPKNEVHAGVEKVLPYRSTGLLHPSLTAFYTPV